MADFAITLDWLSTGQGEPEARQTGAYMAIRVGGPELAVRRRLEAGLGYDPGESPDASIDRAIADNAGTAPVPIVAPLRRFTA